MSFMSPLRSTFDAHQEALKLRERALSRQVEFALVSILHECTELGLVCDGWRPSKMHLHAIP